MAAKGDANRMSFQKSAWEKTGLPRLRRGVNFGNFLESAYEGRDTGGVLLQDEWFPLLKDADFDFVRLPVRWSAHASEDAPYPIEAEFLARVTHLVDTALESGFAVIVNQHHYLELMANPAAHRERFIAFCRRISRHFRDYPDALMFELMNEPNARLTPALWNDYFKEGYRAARAEDGRRALVVDPADWGNITGLDRLSLEGLGRDDRLIATFHYYEPHPFTHQGASWVDPPHPLGRHWTGSAEELSALQADFDFAAAWAERRKLPLFLGEFGAYQKINPMEEIVSWTRKVREEAEKRDIPWCYWEFCHAFGFWDREKKSFKESLLRALIP